MYNEWVNVCLQRIAQKCDKNIELFLKLIFLFLGNFEEVHLNWNIFEFNL